MKNKYNIALIPENETDLFIKCSKYYADIADKYLLGNKSIPHITLYRFIADENEVEDIWKNVCTVLERKSINLIFEKFSCITFDNNIFWTSLLPDRRDALFKIHSLVASSIGKPINNNFDPHLTLMNTKCKKYENIVEKHTEEYSTLQDTFSLALGMSDEVGQITELVFS